MSEPLENGVKTEQSDLTLLLESMKEQEKMAKKTLWHQRIRTILVLVMVLAVVSLVAPVKGAVADAQVLLDEGKLLLASVQTLTQDADKAVDELMLTVESLDLKNTLAGIDALVEESSAVVESSAEDIQKSLEAISGLDVEGLNKSIKALEAVTTSIGRIFGYKG